MKSKGAKKKRKRDQDDSDEADEFSESDSELGEPTYVCTDGLYCVCMHKLCVCVDKMSFLNLAVIWLLVSVTIQYQYTYIGTGCRVDCQLG